MKSLRQAGFTLMELMLVISLVAVMSIIEFQEKVLEVEQMRARQLGMELFRYNSAVQRYLAFNSGTSDPTTVTGVQTGVDWLKDTSCTGGTAGGSYLACNFLSHTNGRTTYGGLTFTTTITYDVAEGFTGRTVLSPLVVAGKPRGDLSGLAALVGAGAYVVKDQPSPPLAQDGAIIYCPDITMSGAMAALCGSERDQIILYSRNLSANDPWLRTDHGNVMHDVLEFRTGDNTPASDSDINAIDATKRQIRNVARIYNLGNSNANTGTDNLILGKRGGTATLANNGVIIDADQEVLGQLQVQTSIRAGADITSTDGNLVARDAAGGNSGGNVIADRDVTAGNNLRAGRDLTVGVNASVGADLRVGDDLVVNNDAGINGSLVVDQTALVRQNLGVHGNAYINGSGSVLGRLGVGDVAFFNRYITVQGNVTSASGDLVANRGNIIGRRFHDVDNTGYYVDPASSSRLNGVQANYLRSNGNIDAIGTIYARGNVNGRSLGATQGVHARFAQLSGTYSEGGGCSTKSIGMTSSGEIMSCVSGRWRKPGGGYSRYTVVSGTYHWQPGPAIRSCPGGWTSLFYFQDRAGDYASDVRYHRVCGRK